MISILTSLTILTCSLFINKQAIEGQNMLVIDAEADSILFLAKTDSTGNFYWDFAEEFEENFDSQEPNNTNCFNIKNFNLFKAYIIENGSNILLQERIITGVETVSIELSFDDHYIELIQIAESDVILIIDKRNKIPAYTCQIKDGKLKLSMYESRIDSIEGKEIRRNDWCQFITTFLAKE
jgi:hypothetical protein